MQMHHRRVRSRNILGLAGRVLTAGPVDFEPERTTLCVLCLISV